MGTHFLFRPICKLVSRIFINFKWLWRLETWSSHCSFDLRFIRKPYGTGPQGPTFLSCFSPINSTVSLMVGTHPVSYIEPGIQQPRLLVYIQFGDGWRCCVQVTWSGRLADSSRWTQSHLWRRKANDWGLQITRSWVTKTIQSFRQHLVLQVSGRDYGAR